MPQSYEAGLPPMVLTNDYIVAFEARDASGAEVTGVTISQPMVLASREGDLVFEEVVPPYTSLPSGP